MNDRKTARPKYLVVIAGSSGSLTPLKTIVGALSPALDAAFVILTHRSPARRSHLAEILGRGAKVSVLNAEDGDALEPGCVYIAPPGERHLLVETDKLRLAAGPKVDFHRPAANLLFQSAAEHFRDHAVAVVLSGMGKNGAEGVAAIKRAGGKAMIQLPGEAESPSMPENALALVTPDFCAPAAAIARRLVHLCAPRRGVPTTA